MNLNAGALVAVTTLNLTDRNMKWLYCLFTWSLLPWRLPRFKIGIATNVPQRIAQIEYELSHALGRPVIVRRAAAFPIIGAGWLERRLHWVFDSLRAKMPKHAGKTEWFGIRNIGGVAILVWLSRQYGFEITPWHVLIVFFLPLPVDGFIVICVAAFLHYAVFCGVAWAFCMILITALNI